MNDPRGSRSQRAFVMLALAAFALAGSTGCDANRVGTLLVPTGIRPAPAVATGSVYGYVFFAPDVMPDLAGPPYPFTMADLYRDTMLVQRDTLATDLRRFEFLGVRPGAYRVVVRSELFLEQSANVTVRDEPVDAGNFVLPVNSAAFNTVNVFLLGDIPGFGSEQVSTFESFFDNAYGLGVWNYPTSSFAPIPIAAGTYRFKLITDASSTPDNLIGWGGDPADTVIVPVINLAVQRGSGPSSDLVAKFPVTGIYALTLDERRKTVSIVPAASTLAHITR